MLLGYDYDYGRFRPGTKILRDDRCSRWSEEATVMADIPRIAVRSPQPFDIISDSFTLCGLGVANKGVLGSATLTGGDGAVLAQLAPMSVPGSGFLFTLFDFTVTYGVPSGQREYSRRSR